MSETIKNTAVNSIRQAPAAVIYETLDMEKTGENIARLRKQSGISVRELQEAFGFTTPQSIYKWQWGQCIPEVQNLWHLARILGVSVDEILVWNHQ